MVCSLEEILKYKNASVINRYQKYYPEKAKIAHGLFEDLLRFFWGTKKHALDKKQNPHLPELDFVYVMDQDMQEIDQMWHVFLLYSRDYMNFCQFYFGEFLHHQPDLLPGLEEKQFDFENNLFKFLNYNCELLGEETMERWFSESVK